MNDAAPGQSDANDDRISVLLVADTDTLADRLDRALAAIGVHATIRRVNPQADDTSEIETQRWDAVVGVEEAAIDLIESSGTDQDHHTDRCAEGDSPSDAPADLVAVPFVFVAETDDEQLVSAAIDRGAARCLLRQSDSAAWDRTLADAVVSAIESRRTQTKLRQRTNELQRIYDTVPAMITRKDDANRILRVNHAVTDYLDRPRESIEGQTAWELFDEYGTEFQQMDQSVIESGEPIKGLIEQLPTPSGQERWLKTDVVPYCDEYGAIDGVLVISEDITELKDRERQLARQNERLDRFISVVAHDLRNPLGVASGRVRLAQADPEGGHLAVVQTAHERMATLIDDLLTLARQGQSVSERSPIALADAVRDSWTTAETHDAVLNDDVSGLIRADPGRLQQLLENLFRNSVEHGGHDVTVTVGLGADGFYIEDDGPGVPADRRESVFEPGHSTTPSGTGFGLSIVREIANAHGWTITVTEGSAGGARFEITGVKFEK